MFGDSGVESASPSQLHCPLITLPHELIIHIVSLVAPGSHLDFACTCKTVAICSATALQLHRESHELYRVTSDIQPSTAPLLLRDACEWQSSIKLWHVRSFELWLHRASWADWKPLWMLGDKLFRPDDNAPARCFSKKEMTQYLDLGRQYLQLSEPQLDYARRELQDGGDGFLKTLLLSMCPRLNSLKVVEQEFPSMAEDIPDEGMTELQEEMRQQVPGALHSMTWLKRAIWNIVDGEPKSAWPSGLFYLREVAVGVRSGRILDHHFDDSRHAFSFEVLCSLLRLPNINSLYYNGLDAGDRVVGLHWDADDENREARAEANLRLPENCSTLKHLYLEDVFDLNDQFRWHLLEAPRALQTASFRCSGMGSYDIDGLFELAGKKQGDSLLGFMLYGNMLRAYYWWDYLLRNAIGRFAALSHLTLDARDFLVDSVYRHNRRAEAQESLLARVSACFPPTLEALFLRGNAKPLHGQNRDALDELEDCLIVWIDSNTPKNLKAICLEDVEKATTIEAGNPRTSFAFKKLVAAGQRAGVDVYTVGNTSMPVHQIDFPVAPDIYDLATGPFGHMNPLNKRRHLSMSSRTGLWEPKGCEHCGTCDSCLAIYTREAWETRGTGHQAQ